MTLVDLAQLNRALAERDAALAKLDEAHEHLAYHLSDYQLNSAPTGDLAVDMASWARRLKAERDAARAEVARLRESVWDEAADLADSVIVSWQGVAGLHPEAQEPHPAALRAAGARRTLVVLRSRMSEAFADRRTALAATDEASP